MPTMLYVYIRSTINYDNFWHYLYTIISPQKVYYETTTVNCALDNLLIWIIKFTN